MTILQVFENDPTIADRWAAAANRDSLVEVVAEASIVDTTRELVEHILAALRVGEGEYDHPAWQLLHDHLEEITRNWRDEGADARSMSHFLRALGAVALDAVPPADLTTELVGAFNDLLDELLLWSLEARLDRLASIVEQQREEMEELTSPVVEVYKGIAVLPLIGTLDSERAEKVMEAMVLGVDRLDARVVVLDITGVPTVDTFVADRLVKTVDAAALMGAHVIISGVGPRIALTMVRVGADVARLETTSGLADALERAFRRQGLRITSIADD